MKTIAYIIGHRNSVDPNRLRNLLLVLKWLECLQTKLLHDKITLKIIIVEQDDTPKLKINTEKLTYIFVYNPGFYNRGWGFNVGFKAIDADYYFFADNDIILNNYDIINVFIKCFKYDAVNPYSKIYDSTDEYVSNPNFDPCKYDPESEKIFVERPDTCFLAES